MPLTTTWSPSVRINSGCALAEKLSHRGCSGTSGADEKTRASVPAWPEMSSDCAVSRGTPRETSPAAVTPIATMRRRRDSPDPCERSPAEVILGQSSLELVVVPTQKRRLLGAVVDHECLPRFPDAVHVPLIRTQRQRLELAVA